MYATRCLILFCISTKYHENIPKSIRLTGLTQNQCITMSNIIKVGNAKSKKGRLVILAHDMLSSHVLHFYQVPLKYSERYLSYRADTKFISNEEKGNDSKRKKASVVVLVHDTSSGLVLHFCQVSLKYSKRYSSYIAGNKFYADPDADADANGVCLKNIMSSTLRYRGTSNTTCTFSLLL